MLQVSETWLRQRSSYAGRSLTTTRSMLRVVNMAEPDETPVWHRVTRRATAVARTSRGQHHETDEKDYNDMSNVPAIPSGLPEGLEDTEASDLSMPIYRIDHEAGCFVNNLTNEEFPEFDAILLGRLKQRILWPMDPGGGAEGPMCRSYDFNTGIPRAETWVQSQKGNSSMTAVKLSGFDFPTVEAAAEGGGLPVRVVRPEGVGRQPHPTVVQRAVHLPVPAGDRR